MSLEPQLLSLLTAIDRFLARSGIQGYIVGGFVRDALLGRDTNDIDLAVTANALEVSPQLAEAIGGHHFPLDEVNRTSRIVLKDAADSIQWQIDLSSIVEDIQGDLARRDFTIDAMAVRLDRAAAGSIEAELIDPHHGLDDIRNKTIRAVSDEIFTKDALRLLRGVRLANELGFGIEPHTEELICQQKQLINSVAGERVRDELLKLLADESGTVFEYLDDLGLLTAVFPELEASRGVDQPSEHQWDVFHHSLKTVAAAGFVLHYGRWQYSDDSILDCVPWTEDLEAYFASRVGADSNRRLLLKLAALLHDVAKPHTKATDAQGRTHFFGHAVEGAETVIDIMERLRFSGKEKRLVSGVVYHHLRPVQTCHDEMPTQRAIYRYFRDTGDVAVDTLFFSLADHLATRGYTLDMANWRWHNSLIRYILEQHKQQQGKARPSRLISGHDIMQAFGLQPGHTVGRLLEAVREAQAAGEVASREQALTYAKKLLNEEKTADRNGN